MAKATARETFESAKYARAGAMTEKELWSLCGVIALVGCVIVSQLEKIVARLDRLIHLVYEAKDEAKTSRRIY